jgi:hypothetical protein
MRKTLISRNFRGGAYSLVNNASTIIADWGRA